MVVAVERSGSTIISSANAAGHIALRSTRRAAIAVSGSDRIGSVGAGWRSNGR